VGECFFWYWPTLVVPDQRPLNGCVCVRVCVCEVLRATQHKIGHFEDVRLSLCVSFCVSVGHNCEPCKSG